MYDGNGASLWDTEQCRVGMMPAWDTEQCRVGMMPAWDTEQCREGMIPASGILCSVGRELCQPVGY